MHSQSPNAINVSVLFLNFLAYHCQPALDLRLGLRMDFSVCPILRPNILGHILFK